MAKLSIEYCRSLFAEIGDVYIEHYLEEIKGDNKDLREIDQEYGNIEKALEQLIAHDLGTTLNKETKQAYLQEYVLALANYWTVRGGQYWNQVVELSTRLIEELPVSGTVSLHLSHYHNLARIFYRFGDYERAFTVIEEGIESVRKGHLEEEKILAHLLYMKSAIHRKTGDYELARRTCLQSLAQMESWKDIRGQAIAYYNLGALDQERGEPSNLGTAKTYLEKSVQIFSNLGMKERIARSCIRLAQIGIQEKDFQTTAKRLEEARAYLTTETLARPHVRLELVTAAFYYHQNKLQLARETAYFGIKLAKNQKLTIELEEFNELLKCIDP